MLGVGCWVLGVGLILNIENHNCLVPCTLHLTQKYFEKIFHINYEYDGVGSPCRRGPGCNPLPGRMMKNLLKFGIPLVLLVFVAWFVSRQFKVSVLVAEAEMDTAVNAVAGTVEVWAYMDINVKAQNRGQIVENAVQAVLKEGLRTGDIMEQGKQLLGCNAMGDAVVERMK